MEKLNSLSKALSSKRKREIFLDGMTNEEIGSLIILHRTVLEKKNRLEEQDNKKPKVSNDTKQLRQDYFPLLASILNRHEIPKLELPSFALKNKLDPKDPLKFHESLVELEGNVALSALLLGINRGALFYSFQLSFKENFIELAKLVFKISEKTFRRYVALFRLFQDVPQILYLTSETEHNLRFYQDNGLNLLNKWNTKNAAIAVKSDHKMTIINNAVPPEILNFLQLEFSLFDWWNDGIADKIRLAQEILEKGKDEKQESDSVESLNSVVNNLQIDSNSNEQSREKNEFGFYDLVDDPERDRIAEESKKMYYRIRLSNLLKVALKTKKIRREFQKSLAKNKTMMAPDPEYPFEKEVLDFYDQKKALKTREEKIQLTEQFLTKHK